LVLHTYHGNIFDGYFSPIKSRIFIFIEQFLAKYTHAIVSISKTQKSDLVNKYAIAPDSKISIIPLGFDLTKFLNITMEDRYKIRQEFCIAEDRILVVITGRLTAIKNHIFLLDVLADCKMRLGIKMTTLIVGDGELKEQLFQYCTRLGLSYAEKKSINGTEDVIFASWRKDIPAINAASDICVLTSLNEGTPVSIIEAMASAKPILATRVGGIEDFVEDGISGMLSSLDVKEFSSKFDSLLSDSSLRFKMGQVARKSVEHKFSHSRLVSDMDSLYSSLLKEKYV
jgi:glycosyltransferase involved in cell wall biosynthesis